MNPRKPTPPPDTAVSSAWRFLSAAAFDHGKTTGFDPQLHDASLEYAKAVWASKTGAGGTKPSAGPKKRSGLTLPFGRSRGTPLEEAAPADLRWVLGVVVEGLDDPKKERFRASNVALRDAIETELAGR